MNNAKLINILKNYIQSEDSAVRIDNPYDAIEAARSMISPDQSNALDREIQILEELIVNFDVAGSK